MTPQSNGNPVIIKKIGDHWRVVRPGGGWIVRTLEPSYESAKQWAERNGFLVIEKGKQ